MLHTGYRLDALLHPQICATPLKFKPNRLEVGRLGTMRVLMLNYKCSLPGLNIFSFIPLLVPIWRATVTLKEHIEEMVVLHS